MTKDGPLDPLSSQISIRLPLCSLLHSWPWKSGLEKTRRGMKRISKGSRQDHDGAKGARKYSKDLKVLFSFSLYVELERLQRTPPDNTTILRTNGEHGEWTALYPFITWFSGRLHRPKSDSERSTRQERMGDLLKIKSHHDRPCRFMSRHGIRVLPCALLGVSTPQNK